MNPIEAMNANPYFYACPISATSRSTPDKVWIAAGFVARAKDSSLHLVLPAHLASDLVDLWRDDFSSWLTEIRTAPSPNSQMLTLPLFEGARPLFNYRKGKIWHIDAISLRIPNALIAQFETVNVIDLGKSRAATVGERVRFYGFPPMFEKWPGLYPWPVGGKIETEFLCHAQRDVCRAYSGSAVLAGNNDLVGMVVGAGNKPALIPGDIIAALVNDEPLPREIPVFVHDGKIKIGAE